MQHYIIQNNQDFADLQSYVADNTFDVVALDLETDSVNEVEAKPYGIGLAFQSDEAFYIPIRRNNGELWWSEEKELSIIDWIFDACKSKKLIGHNIIYDVLVIDYSYGYDLTPFIHSDTILLKHMVDEEPPFGLKEVAVKYLGPGADQAQKDMFDSIARNGGSITKSNLQMFKADTDILGKYCAHDVMLTYQLYELFSKRLTKEGLDKLFYIDEVMPLYKEVTIPMKRNGMKVDIEHFNRTKEKIDTKIVQLEDKIYSLISDDIADFEASYLDEEYPEKRTGNYPKEAARIVGLSLDSIAKKVIEKIEPASMHQINFKDWMLGNVDVLMINKEEIQRGLFRNKNPDRRHIFNFKSKDHLKHLFFDVLGERPLSTTEGGEPQVDDAFLESVIESYPWVDLLRDLNVLHKMKGTYIDGILEKTTNGRLYTSFLQFGTTSGRFASRSPNCQNWPSAQKTDTSSMSKEMAQHKKEMDEIVNSIRHGLVANVGCKLIGSDFSSLEPHIAAYVSGDEGLIDIFVTGKDFYSAIAIKQFNLEHLSAYKDDPNYLGVLDKDSRNKTKTYCFTGNTFISTPKGFQYIKDLQEGDTVNTIAGPRKVIKTFKRSAPTINFLTSKGGFTCTSDHKIWNKTTLQFMEASTFNLGDEVELDANLESSDTATSLPLYSTTAFGNRGELRQLGTLELNTDWGYVIGAFLGDGIAQYSVKYTRQREGFVSNYSTGYVGICGIAEDEVLTHFETVMNKYGFRSSKDYIVKKLTSKRFYGKELVGLFQNTFNLFSDSGTHTRKKLEVPPYIMNGNLSLKISFIAGLFDTDGYLKRHHNKAQSDVAWCTKSSEFANQLILLLRSIGVDSTTMLSWNKTYKKNYYVIRVSTAGIYQLKQLGLAEYLVCSRKREAIQGANAPKLRKSSTSKVLLIEPNVESTVYDITVEDVHEFYANGIRVHNCLAAFYGATAPRISQVLGSSKEEAQELLDGYLEAFPGIKSFIERSHSDCNYKGQVKTVYGRVRHLAEAKLLYNTYGANLTDFMWAQRRGVLDERKTYRNMLNNAVNFQIQGMAAHVINRAMIKIAREFKANQIDGYICSTIHDEVLINVNEEQVDLAASIVKNCMETAVNLDPIKLKATPIVGNSYGDCK